MNDACWIAHANDKSNTSNSPFTAVPNIYSIIDNGTLKFVSILDNVFVLFSRKRCTVLRTTKAETGS
jgi:hypothetical protein